MKTPGEDRGKECGTEAAGWVMEITVPMPLDDFQYIKIIASIAELAKILGIKIKKPVEYALSADRTIVRIGVFKTEADKDLMAANLHRLNDPEIEYVAKQAAERIVKEVENAIRLCAHCASTGQSCN